MQSMEILYYALFAVSIAATITTFTLPNNQEQELLAKSTEKRLTKREAAIFVLDSLPAESITNSQSKRIYKRLSKPRHFVHAHGPKMHDNKNIPKKKHKSKKNKPMRSAPSAKNRLPKSSHRYYVPGKSPPVKKHRGKKPAKRLTRPSIPEFPYQHPQRIPPVVEQRPMSFGEPPIENPRYHDLPVDSYGAPLRPTVRDPNLRDTDIDKYNVQNTATAPDYADWPIQTPMDSKFAYSNNYQSYASPSKFEKEENVDDIYTYVPSKYNNKFSKIKHLHFKNVPTAMNKPWLRLKMKEEEDKVLVGGQYAEPPGRYVPMSHPNGKLIFDDSEQFSTGDVVHVMDIEHSATVSPYVNYKNSNMAFSPQNLNDVFSLDK